MEKSWKSARIILKNKDRAEMYTLILQHNATKKEYVINNLRDVGNNISYVFENFTMPAGAQDGEYTGALFYNGRIDVTYTMKDVLLNTILHTGEGDCKLRDLLPEVFLMKYGKGEQTIYIYRDTDVEYVFYQRKDNE